MCYIYVCTPNIHINTYKPMYVTHIYIYVHTHILKVYQDKIREIIKGSFWIALSKWVTLYIKPGKMDRTT